MSQTAPPPAGMAPRRAAHPGQAAPAFVASGGRQRRWSLALVAVLVTVGSGLAFVLLWLNAGDRRPYLAVTTDVQRGQQIQPEHLTTVRVSTDPTLSPVPASQRNDIVGQVATKELAAGSLLVDSAIGEEEGLPQGEAVTAVPVAAQRVPSPIPRSGARVRIYDSSDVDQDSTEDEQATAEAIAEATVLGTEDFGTEVTFTVRVSDSLELADIAKAAQTGGVHLALVNER